MPGEIFRFDDIPFDAGWNFDSSNNFDNCYNTSITIDDQWYESDQYIAKETHEFVITSEWEIDDRPSKYIDLLQLVPEKFRDSELLQVYLKAVGVYAGSWLSKIDDLGSLIDTKLVPRDYAQHLANLIGLKLTQDETTTSEELHRQINQAIDLYKLKGTYENVAVAAYAIGITINVYDMYTNDYVNFVREEWFVGDQGENPPGLDSSYYKSPHFGLEILLNRRYYTNNEYYLWKYRIMTQLIEWIERIRPVNTVPHYSLLLNPVGKENGQLVVGSGYVMTKAMGAWQITKLYFDEGDRFDDGKYFDWSLDSFLSLVTRWKIGIGNKGVSPDVSGFDIETPVLSGNITTVRKYSDRVEFEFTIPKETELTGASELGIYLSDDTTLVVASTFPDIDKSNDTELRILVQIYAQ